jgi:hypothetical protein
MFLGWEYVEPGMAGHAVPRFCSIGAGMVGNRAGIKREAA